MANKMQFLIVRACFYNSIADHLLEGAKALLAQNGMIESTEIDVPGALEIPPAIAMAREKNFNGYIALGCVIRGETAHYDIVAQQSAQGLMDLSLRYGLAIGNGILTCDTMQQASVRADPALKNKGKDAAEACLALAKVKKHFLD